MKYLDLAKQVTRFFLYIGADAKKRATSEHCNELVGWIRNVLNLRIKWK